MGAVISHLTEQPVCPVGHLLVDRLQDADADVVADPARTEAAETMLRESKGAGQ
jgi:hypothetical protein